MEQLEKLMLWGFGILAFISVALSSFATQDQQLAGQGGFDAATAKPMIFLGYALTGIFCGFAWWFTKERAFAYAGLAIVIGGLLWVYAVSHPVFQKEVTV